MAVPRMRSEKKRRKKDNKQLVSRGFIATARTSLLIVKVIPYGTNSLD